MRPTEEELPGWLAAMARGGTESLADQLNDLPRPLRLELAAFVKRAAGRAAAPGPRRGAAAPDKSLSGPCGDFTPWISPDAATRQDGVTCAECGWEYEEHLGP